MERKFIALSAQRCGGVDAETDPHRSCNHPVFVDEAARDAGSLEVPAAGLTGRSRTGVAGGRCPLAGGPVRTVPVVVLDVLAEHGFEVTSSEVEHVVEALSPDGAHGSLGDGLRPWRPDRSP